MDYTIAILMLVIAVVLITSFVDRSGDKAEPKESRKRQKSKRGPRSTFPKSSISKPKPAKTDRDPPPPPEIPASRQLIGRAYVIDGDTISIRRVKIRLAGIDAPELDQPWGQKSKWEMVKICKGHTIRVELTGETSYDRLVGTCYLPDGRDIGAEIIKAGLALDGGHYSKGKYRHLESKDARQRLKSYGHWRETISNTNKRLQILNTIANPFKRKTPANLSAGVSHFLRAVEVYPTERSSKESITSLRAPLSAS